MRKKPLPHVPKTCLTSHEPQGHIWWPYGNTRLYCTPGRQCLHLPCHHLGLSTLLQVYFGMAVGTYMYLRSTKPPAASSCQHHPTKEGEEEEVFDRIADIYDNKIGFDETVCE